MSPNWELFGPVTYVIFAQIFCILKFEPARSVIDKSLLNNISYLELVLEFFS